MAIFNGIIILSIVWSFFNSKKCINNLGSYHCQCNLGFEGNGYFCNDIDECDSFRFVGDGCDLGKFWKVNSCLHLDSWSMIQCSHVIHGSYYWLLKTIDKDATCQNTPGSFICICNNGFKGSESLTIACVFEVLDPFMYFKSNNNLRTITYGP